MNAKVEFVARHPDVLVTLPHMKLASTSRSNISSSADYKAELSDTCFACILWGTKYPREYVTRLARAVERNLTVAIPFFCISDQASHAGVSGANTGLGPGEARSNGLSLTIPRIDFVSPPNELPGWWQKVNLFDRDLLGKRYVIYCDLDVVVLKSLSFLERYLGRADLTHAQDLLDPMSSSFMIIDTESRLAEAVLRDFDYDEFSETDANDQAYFSRFVTSGKYHTRGLLPQEHYSYKYLINHDRWHSRNVNPIYRVHGFDEIHTLNFHGVPNPHDLEAQPNRWPFAAEVLTHW
ncbi:MAG: hypothetical protein U0136_03960 [Bdellovibrionota bacterium]